MQTEMARRDSAAVVGLTAANALNARQESRLAALEAGMKEMGDNMKQMHEMAVGAIHFDAPIHFAYDSYEIEADSKPTLDRFAHVVNRHWSGALITVEGFADPAGSGDYNKWLGQKRAEAVMQYLVEAGVDAGQLRAVSYGDARDRQVEPGAWGENGLANRRVAFVVDYSEGM